MCVVSKIMYSDDNRVRKVEITYKRGDMSITVNRPVQRIIVLVPNEEKEAASNIEPRAIVYHTQEMNGHKCGNAMLALLVDNNYKCKRLYSDQVSTKKKCLHDEETNAITEKNLDIEVVLENADKVMIETTVEEEDNDVAVQCSAKKRSKGRKIHDILKNMKEAKTEYTVDDKGDVTMHLSAKKH